MTNAESVKARLKNLSRTDGGTMQDKLTLRFSYLQLHGVC